ncbi:MAG: DNA polymerase Y family protein [Gammaproteobacteria bacterium]|nr:DNA polymerase Y family protein [Gammaproteobacteria bacterium]
MLWLAVHFPSFGLEVATRGIGQKTAEKQAIKEQAIEEQTSPDTSPAPAAELRVLIYNQQVIQCNSAAAACGIHPGNSLATAQSLAAGALRHFHWNGAHEEARLLFIAEVLYRFSSEVSPEAPDAIVLEAGRSLKLFGDLSRLIAAVTSACANLGHEIRVRAAATPLAALALARSGAHTLPEVSLQSLATGFQPLSPSHSATQVSRRVGGKVVGEKAGEKVGGKVGRESGGKATDKRDCTLPNRMVERLHNMGLTRLGQVFALPRAELAHRFGHSFATYLDRLAGRVPDPRTTIQPPDRFDQSLHLLEPLRDKAALEEPMRHLLYELGQWLVAHQLGAEALVWSFSAHDVRSRTCMPVRFARVQQQRSAFIGISLLKLAETPLPEDVLSIGLKARRLKPWIAQNHNLFPDALLAPAGFDGGSERSGDHSAESTTRIELLDQLGARLGESACLRLEPLDRHTPEEAWQPLSVFESPRHRLPPAPPGKRPLWLFTPPRPVNVDELVLLDGPERIQGQWWTRPVSRDYYIATHRNGARCWAFVDDSRQWYLHGYFA